MALSYLPQSKSDVHLTPDRVYEIIQKKWSISKEKLFDPCPLNPSFDGLSIPWKDVNFVNPPYTLLKEFVHKAITETEYGRMTILLLPAKTDQEWFHELLAADYEMEWIRKRLKFKNNINHSPQPHFLVKIE